MRLHIAASPHLKDRDSTERIMWSVVITLLPVLAAGVWFFGISALLVTAATTIGAVLTERMFGPGGSIRDGSAAITGLLLGLTLPASFPLWMAVMGGAIAIGVGKLVFGGLGQNVFNPALIGRAFLQAAFPTAITTWPQVAQGWTTIYASNFAVPLFRPQTADLVTAATPLGLMKFEQTSTNAAQLFIGNVGGSLGETSALLILLGGGYLAWK
ncbi:MAG TPA: RnfABCDGE type electron transport complex subunit D, partial [Longimicrobiales bacterium]